MFPMRSHSRPYHTVQSLLLSRQDLAMCTSPSSASSLQRAEYRRRHVILVCGIRFVDLPPQTRYIQQSQSNIDNTAKIGAPTVMTNSSDESNTSGSIGRVIVPVGRDATAEELYLDLFKKCLTRSLFEHLVYEPITVRTRSLRGKLKALVHNWLRDSRQIEMVRIRPFNHVAREEGRDWPLEAETMIGLRRLDNIEYCVTDVLRQQVPGDLIETGVWRGGAAIFMRAILKAYKNTERVVWVADSFEGLPKPNPERYPADAGDRHWTASALAVSLEEVKANFARYDLLDEQVRSLVGWFRDTLPTSPIRQLAVLRLDGDMYESTMDSLHNLYPRLSKGGYVIVDDYGAVPGCRAAVDDFRREHKITATLRQIDWTGMFLQREQ